MRVLLINPGRTFARRKVDRTAIGLPVGLLYVASALRKAGHDVTLLDCLINAETVIKSEGRYTNIGLPDDILESSIKKSQADFVGVGAPFTIQWDNTLRVVRRVKKILPQATIVVGGPHASVCYSDILSRAPEVDFVVRGEGEVSFPALIGHLSAGAVLTSISGLTWRDSEGKIKANEIEFINDLDALPFPAYDLVDSSSFKLLEKIGIFARSKTPHAAEVITSRGCPYKCVFCSINLSMGYQWRYHSVGNVIENIKLLKHVLGVKHVHFEDDNFTFSQKRSKKMFEEFIEEDIGISWDTPNGVRADTLDETILETAKRSGCIGLMVAAESGDQHVVNKIIKKNIKLSSIESAARSAYKIGIPMGSFYIVGFPGESKINIKTTFRFALDLFSKYNLRPHFHVAAPLPGTDLHTDAIKKGMWNSHLAPSDFHNASSLKHGGLIKTDQFDRNFIILQYYLFLFRFALSRLYKVLNYRRLFGLNVIPAALRNQQIQ